MTEVTTLLFSIMFCLGGVAIGFIFGWFGNTYFTSFIESKLEVPMHPEMIDEGGFLVNEELLAVRFIDDEDWDEDTDED
jgi:ABC-type antimicrobial peptide transport system permease subunit|tara:strand:- start:2696 stop:2932 length:237 start_codon:yes stop_codon:yes gene_type:complete